MRYFVPLHNASQVTPELSEIFHSKNLYRDFKCLGINENDIDQETTLPKEWKSRKPENIFQLKYADKKGTKFYASIVYPDKNTLSINLIKSDSDDEIHEKDINMDLVNLDELEVAILHIYKEIEKPILDKIAPKPKENP
jgi:hypothetical protein